jgi:general secretion pathway protein C
MQSIHHNLRMRQKWILPIASFALCALLAASVLYWVLPLFNRGSPPMPAPAMRSAAASVVDGAALARVLGAPQTAASPVGVAASGRFALKGVVAAARGGVALIAVDGKPAKPYAVGAVVEGAYLLKAVGARFAVLGASVDKVDAGLKIELPPVSAAEASVAATPLKPNQR